MLGCGFTAKSASFLLAKTLRRKVFSQYCHFDEGEISARNSAIKITNLCRATYGDFSFVEMIYFVHLEVKFMEIRVIRGRKLSTKKIPNPTKVGIWNFYPEASGL
jgi:hypothetical protein